MYVLLMNRGGIWSLPIYTDYSKIFYSEDHARISVARLDALLKRLGHDMQIRIYELKYIPTTTAEQIIAERH